MNDKTPAPLSPEQARAQASAPWPRPRPLSRPVAPALDLSAAIPPGLPRFREFCTASAEALQFPPDAVAPLAVALVSIGTARACEVELAPQWRETAPLWFCALLEPGERKSALLGLLSASLHEWQTREREFLRHALAAYAERRRVLEARLAGVRDRCKRAKDHSEAKAFELEALALTAELENLPPLSAPELVTSNTTPEALRDLLARNGEKAALVSAETDAGQLLGSRYSKTGSANVDLFLQAFTGDPAPAHRIGKDVALARPALSLALCVQPEALRAVLGDSTAKGRGLIDRLCFVAPTSRMGSRSLDPAPVPPALLEWWAETLRRVLDLKWPGRVVLSSDGPTLHVGGPHVLRLSPDARPVFEALRADLENRIGETGDLRPISGFVSKLPGVVARIACALEAMQDPASPAISAATMRAAVAWAPFLLGHFRAVLGDAAEPSERKDARRLLAALKRHALADFSARDALRLCDGLRAEDAPEVLAELEDAGWIRPLPAPTPDPVRTLQGGRPASPRFTVNPAALSD